MATSNGKTAVREETILTIAPPNIQKIIFSVIGTAPYMQARFTAKAMQAMHSKQAAGSTARKGTKREPRDFDEDFVQAQHRSSEGWAGIPAAAVRNACIDACRMVGYEMTRARMSIFVDSDGLDAVDGSPLIRLNAAEPERTELAVRNQTGVVDLRVRPMWREWSATISIKYDADQFTAADVANLLARAGLQVGLGEGRPFSKKSNGMGFGLFRIAERSDQ
jgi:hypothetical protein